MSPLAIRWLTILISVGWCALQFAPALFGPFEYEMIILGTHVGAAVSLGLLLTRADGKRRASDERLPRFDLLLLVANVACYGYLLSQAQRIAERIAGVDAVSNLDVVVGSLLIVLLLEACRRAAGAVLTCVAAAFLLYLLLGPYLPSMIAHRGMSVMRLIDLQILSFSGIFGTPISASAHMVFYFVLVGAFLELSGAGRLFVDIAHSLTARARGGAGKAAVVSSGLFGMISGSAVSNVLLSGLMTIPLMKRAGFAPKMAASIEATASTGGQLAPPIMGAAAFILADIVGVSYDTVVIAAIVPALLYYASIYIVVHFYALRQGMEADPKASILDPLRGFGQRWHLLIPLVLMVVMLIERYSLMMVGIVATFAIVLVSSLRASTRMKPADILEALMRGVRAASDVAIPSAVAGIIVGALIHSGMAINMQRAMLAFAGDSSLIALAGAALLTIVLGMGMPTAAAYMVSAILVAPALQSLGVPALASHLFILYFGILSMVTPPVALSAYAAAGIAESNLWSTGVQSFLLAIPGFLIPFAFAFNDALILQGDPIDSIRTIVSCLLGVALIASAVAGYLLAPLSLLTRVSFVVVAPLLVFPSWTSDLLGLALAGAIVFVHWLATKSESRARQVTEA